MAYRKVGDRKYDFDVRIHGQRYRKRVSCPASLVKSLYRDWERKIYNGEILKDYSFFEKLDEYLYFVKANKSESTYQLDLITITVFKKFFNDMPLRDFRRSHVEDFIVWRRNHPMRDNTEKVADSSINRNIAVLSSFFNWCRFRGYYNLDNPTFKTKLKVNNVREVELSEEQIKELLTKAKEQGDGIFIAVLIALGTGMRRGEIFSLRWSNIDFNKSRISLSKDVTKGDKRRFIALPEFLKSHLLKLRSKNPFHEKVFHDWKTDNKLRFEWNRLREKLSFGKLRDGTKLRLHDIRHVYAQLLLDSGIQLEDVQNLLGHSSVTTTQDRYAMFARKDLVEKVGVLDDVLSI